MLLGRRASAGLAVGRAKGTVQRHDPAMPTVGAGLSLLARLGDRQSLAIARNWMDYWPWTSGVEFSRPQQTQPPPASASTVHRTHTRAEHRHAPHQPHLFPQRMVVPALHAEALKAGAAAAAAAPPQLLLQLAAAAVAAALLAGAVILHRSRYRAFYSAPSPRVRPPWWLLGHVEVSERCVVGAGGGQQFPVSGCDAGLHAAADGTLVTCCSSVCAAERAGHSTRSSCVRAVQPCLLQRDTAAAVLAAGRRLRTTHAALCRRSCRLHQRHRPAPAVRAVARGARAVRAHPHRAPHYAAGVGSCRSSGHPDQRAWIRAAEAV